MNWNKIKHIIGPGILFASTAIGVSHLVQSTRAGANYGFALIGFIIAANIFKYPFFEYGSRYANATGESLIDGYYKLGKPVLMIFFMATIGSMFFVSAGVGLVTIGFMDNLFGLSDIFPSFSMFPTFLLFAVALSVLLIGNFNILDNLIKIIGLVLFISTILAFILTINHGQTATIPGFQTPEIFSKPSLLFIIALMGWMPTALDLSTWNSLWTIEKIKSSGFYPSLKETLFEFNFGYWIAAILSICFLTIGAFLMYGTGIQMPNGSGDFASSIIKLYTTTIGEWSFIIISASAFSIMFGTFISVFDGYSRTLERSYELLFLSPEDAKNALNNRKTYKAFLVILSVGSLILINYFIAHFKTLIDLATTISFLIAPFVAYANIKLVTKKYIGKEAIPPFKMRLLSYLGFIFLTGFALFYFYVRFFK